MCMWVARERRRVGVSRFTQQQSLRRLFFALEPPQDVRTQIVNIRDECAAQNSGSLVSDSNIHLTLQFLGGQPDALIPRLVSAVESLQTPPFLLTLERFGFWKRPRVLWLGTQITPVSLLALHAGIGGVVKKECGIVPESREYTPHVTLMRKVGKVDSLPAVAALTWEVRSFSLMESTSTHEGVRYQSLSSWELHG